MPVVAIESGPCHTKTYKSAPQQIVAPLPSEEQSTVIFTYFHKTDLTISTMAQAEKRGRLSPTLAETLAMKLEESLEHWIAIAAVEAEKGPPLLQRPKKSQAHWRKL